MLCVTTKLYHDSPTLQCDLGHHRILSAAGTPLLPETQPHHHHQQVNLSPVAVYCGWFMRCSHHSVLYTARGSPCPYSR